jgi:hypothetical protein
MKNLPALVLVSASIFGFTETSYALPAQITTSDGTWVFSDFGIGGAFAGQESSIQAEETGSGTAADPFGIIFSRPFVVQTPGTAPEISFQLRYHLQSTDGTLIAALEQGLEAIGRGLGNTLSSVEKVWSDGFGAGTLLAESSLSLTAPIPTFWQSQQLVFSQADGDVWVTKDITLTTGAPEAGQLDPVYLSLNFLGQRIVPAAASAVPDLSSTGSLLSLGLLSFGLCAPRFRRRR